MVLSIQFLSIPLFSQVTFEKTYGIDGSDYGYSLVQTADEGFALFGVQPVFGGVYSNSIIVKTDKFGTKLWSKSFGDSIHGFQGWDIFSTSNGGFLLKSGINQQNGLNLINLDSSGNVLWNKTYYSNGYYSFGGIAEAIDGGYVFLSKKFQSSNTYLTKTNIYGDSIWSKPITLGDTTGFSIKAVSDGYVICGGSNEYVSYRAILIKIDSEGNRIWTKSFGNGGYNVFNSMDLTDDGGIILVGQSSTSFPEPDDLYLVKVNGFGHQLWSRTFGGDGTDWGHSVKQTSDGGYIAFGVTQSFGDFNGDFYLVKTNSGGNEEWHKIYGSSSPETGFCVVQASDNGYAMLGHISKAGYAASDMYLIKTNEFGDVIDPGKVSSDELIVYPNPTSQDFKVGGVDFSVNQINLFDALGQLVKEINYPVQVLLGDQTIDVSGLKKGYYTVEFISGEKKFFKPFIKN